LKRAALIFEYAIKEYNLIYAKKVLEELVTSKVYIYITLDCDDKREVSLSM
jgi:hypothetical protein